jgi:hypothetical protein
MGFMADFRRVCGTALGVSALLLACGTSPSSDKADAARASSAKDAAAPGPGIDGDLGRWVGQVEDSDVRVAVLAGATQARIFFCGGAESYAQATRWLNLDVDTGEVRYDQAGFRVHASIQHDRVAGEIERDAQGVHAFQADLVDPATLAGLYEGQAGCGRLGLIVAQPSEQSEPVAQGACVGEGHPPEQVNPILPIAQELGRIRVQTPDTNGAQTTLLQRANLQPLMAAVPP